MTGEPAKRRERLRPAVACPRCQSERTRTRFTRFYKTEQRVIRHRECLKCRCRFRTSAPAQPEVFAGMDPAAP